MTPTFDLWFASLHDAYLLAKGERLGELRGKRARRWDDSGIHPESHAWGLVRACERLEPWLADLDAYPTLLRAAGREDAEAAFRDEILLGAVIAGEIQDGWVPVAVARERLGVPA